MKQLLLQSILLLLTVKYGCIALLGVGTVDVYKTIQPDKHTRQGTFESREGYLLGHANSVLETSYDLPIEYDVTWEFASSSTAVNLLLVSPKGKRFEWMMKGYEHLLCGLRQVNGKEANANPTTVEYAFESDRRYRCEVRVRKNRFIALIDGKMILNYRTDWSEVEIIVPWHTTKLRPRSLGIWLNKHFTKTFKLEVRELSEQDLRIITGKNGNEIEVVILKQGERSMTVRRKDGIVFDFAYDLLSDADRRELDPANRDKLVDLPKHDNLTEPELVEELQANLRKVNKLPKLTVEWNANLKTLQVRGNGKGFTNLDPIAATPLKIENLDLSRQHELTNKSLRSLAKLQLKSLFLAGSKIDDISVLQGMPLEKLRINCYGDKYFPSCKVQDLSPLKGMPLKELFIDACDVRSLAPLEGMPLERLFMRGVSGVSDLSPLKNTQSLKVLYVDGTDIRSLEDLSIIKLDELHFNQTRVSSLEPLKNMTLLSLSGDKTMVSSVAPIKGDRLQRLYLQSTHLNDLSPLSEMPNLRYFGFADSQVKDFSPLAKCKQLTTLTLTDPRKAENLEVLRGLPLSLISFKPSAPYRHTWLSVSDFWKWVADPSLELVNHGWDKLVPRDSKK
ncbi:MAG: hypothetical protein O3A82_12220 [Verrucomicrobia bacterium]|nr:hypothetical protein [Verrucomicrobiota bacterium]